MRLPLFRAWRAFRFLHTVFVTFRRKDRFLGLKPLPPERFKRSILDLGVCFIKMAQVLATRADFFTQDYLNELKTIHDEVEPMTEAELDGMFNKAFGQDTPFAHFERRPLASASIGQVHRARLKNDDEVAVKIRRRGIQKRVLGDIRIIRFFLKIFQPFFSHYTRNSLEALITEFTTMILKEVDLAVELEHLRKFRETYAKSGVCFPEPYPEHSNSDALVMSFEPGARIDDKQALASFNIEFSQVLDKLLKFYTEQMLIKGYFHADPHPGNLLVRENGELVLLDFGMVKRLPKQTRIAMIEVAKAANEQDFELLIAAYRRMGVIAPSAPQAQMEELAERMFDIFSNESLSAASMQALAFNILNSMKEFPFKLPQDVVYILRASALIEGLGTTYIENFNGVKDILPVLKKNLYRAMGAEAKIWPTVKSMATGLPLALTRWRTIVSDLSDGNLRVKLSHETVEVLAEEMRCCMKPLCGGLIMVLLSFFLLFLDFTGREYAAGTLFLLGALKMYGAVK